MLRITVSLRERSYPIIIGAGLFKYSSSFWPLKEGDSALLVTNTTIAPFYLEKISKLLCNANIKISNVILPDGEQYKSWEVMDNVFHALLHRMYGRDAILIALGGGVIGDLTGFAAASYQRGIRFIQAPTTLLSQVDSSVGGKTSVNHKLGKNMIGAFYQPSSVIIDTDCLASLPKCELSSGLAEVIKYAIIFDIEFFKWLEKNIKSLLALEQNSIEYCIRSCCEIKAKIVQSDERELGMRTLLNLGHTFGHAIEAYMGYGTWSHGEAVSAGIVMAARIAERLCQFNSSHTSRIIDLLYHAGLPVNGPSDMKSEDYLPYMMRDKKTLGGRRIRLVLPYYTIGAAKIHEDISHDVILETIETCRKV